MPTIIDSRTVFAAFEFGYESMRLYRMEDYRVPDEYQTLDDDDEPTEYQELVLLYSLRPSLDDIATEVQPNSFLILLRTLDELRDCGARILASPEDKATITSYRVWSYEDRRDDAVCLSTAISRWFGLSNRFDRIASRGVLGDSPYRNWYDCGRIIGACLIGNEPLEDISDLKLSLQNLPNTFRAFEGNAWLNTLSTFDFGTKGIEGWLREVPSDDLFDLGLNDRDIEVTDYQTLFKRAYRAVWRGIFTSPEECLLPDATGGHNGKPVVAAARKRCIPLTRTQEAILGALKGKAMTKEKLASMLKLGSGGRLYRPGGILELMDQGLVKNLRGIGYFSVESPPPTWPSASEPDGD